MISALRKKIRLSSRLRRSDGPGASITPVEAPSSHDVTTSLRPETFSPRSFSHVPLQDSTNDLRLVVLDPATDPSSIICCEVLNSSLDSTCDYEALSYVWGKRQAVNPIFLRHASSSDDPLTRTEADSFEFSIRLNLETALRALRLPDKPRTLWIDSICIDQSNSRERGDQVLLMSRIYRQCRRDLLWLGSETHKIRRAMDLIQRLATCTDNEAKLSEFQEDEWSDIEAMIGANPVWSRIWIVQELYFAPKILLFCHGQSLDWDVVVKMVDDNEEFKDIWVNQLGSKVFQEVHRCFKNITTFHTIRHELSVAQGLSLRSLMSIVLTFGIWEATEPVDRIYGLLNIAEDAKGFPVDYEKSLDEVAIDFAHHIITRKKSLLILSAALGDPVASYRTSTEKAPIRTLPSWIMDISKHIPSVSGLTMCGRTPYNACGRMAEPMYNFSPDRRRLTASGWLIDTVNVLNNVSPITDSETPRQRWIRDVRRWAPEDGMERLYIPTNETFLNAYWRTITTDRKQDRRITTQDVEDPTWYGWYQSLEERTVPDEQVVLPGWRFGTSKGGIFCMLPPAAEEGDLIAVLFGAKIPYLLRPIELGGDEYKLVGEAYMHGFMDGEVLLRVVKGIYEGNFYMPTLFRIL